MTYLVEYIGPILFHAMAYHFLPSFSVPALGFSKDSSPATDVQSLVYFCFMAHFVKRELETMFLHSFSRASMPFYMIFRNSTLYWVGFGLCSALSVYASTSPTRIPREARSGLGIVDYAGLSIFMVGYEFPLRRRGTC